ncbi:alpha/beta hydrolase [candidate division KSB1 bacterium]|nr:MAG: alpha/beta hydrolase [candidate division KSB1 bacterium]MBC6946348.1 alpha/beta hydrolase [candidate division KSB1 bacterium]MCE7940701.1 alpha/beta hydrolase [Chlorobi bacterium CHB1]MDL1874090.1 alpha/beta hydrolase [Cytophagia bacterium CHB2]
MKTKSTLTRHYAGRIALAAVYLFLAVFSIEVLNAQEKKSMDVASSPPRVEIPGSQLQKITSAIVGQEYDLYIHLPRNYGSKDQKHPVLYLLDAQWDFPLVTAIFGQQFYDGFLPGLVIVGITWGGKNPNHDSLRARDLTPNNAAPLLQSGGAPKFLAFIKQELIPFIESKYLVSGDRTLMGSSFGGLFTLYALFSETELFQRYVLTSPAVGWANEGIYAFEKNYADKKSQLPARLFMAVGELEDVAGFQKFADQLKARNYDGLALQTRVLENTGHSGTKAEGYTRGLQFVFARPSLKLAAAILAQYVGTFEPNPETKVLISVENDHLIAQGPYNTKLVLHAETEQDFYVPGQYLFARFKKDEQGRVTGFQLAQFGGEVFARKVGAPD